MGWPRLPFLSSGVVRFLCLRQLEVPNFDNLVSATVNNLNQALK